VAGRTVGLYVRYADFDSSFNKQQTLHAPSNLTDDIFRSVLAILDTVTLPQPVRLLGVRITNLRHQGDQQLPLFPQERRKVLATLAMDAINARFGDKVTFGTLLVGEESVRGSHVISPAWRPEGIRCVDVQ